MVIKIIKSIILFVITPKKAASRKKRKDSSSEDEQSETEKVLPDIFEKAQRESRDSDDSFDDNSDSDSEPEKVTAVKKMPVRSNVALSALYDPSKSNELKEMRKVEEETPLAKRIASANHEEVRHVKGGKVFTIQRKQDKKGKDFSVVSKIPNSSKFQKNGSLGKSRKSVLPCHKTRIIFVVFETNGKCRIPRPLSSDCFRPTR